MNPRPFSREPLAIVLVIVNLALAGALIYRHSRRGPRPGELPPGHPDVSVPAELTSAGTLALSGLVKLSPALKDPWPKDAHVFVIARADEAGGPPYATRRYDHVKPPFAWSLGPENVMLGGAVPARVRLSVRVDQDGDAMTRQLGDLEGGPSEPLLPRGTYDLVVDRPATLVR